MYAIIKCGSKQCKVQEGDYINIDKLDASPKDTVEITDVLAVSNGDFKIGTPFVEGAKVTLEVVTHGKDKKVIAFFKRRRQDSKRKVGFRREFTRVKISKITA